MSVESRRKLFRYSSAAMSFVLLWMCGIAVLSHSDCDDDYLNANPGAQHLTLTASLAGADQCVACAWNDAANIYLPTLLLPPSETPYVSAAANVSRVRPTSSVLRAALSRGPPIAC